jgi:hypothetical protein
MYFFFQNIDPPPPFPPGECVPPPLLRGEDTIAWWRGGGEGQYFGRRKTQLCTPPISVHGLGLPEVFFFKPNLASAYLLSPVPLRPCSL